MGSKQLIEYKETYLATLYTHDKQLQHFVT